MSKYQYYNQGGSLLPKQVHGFDAESAHGLEVAEIEFSSDENEVELIKY